MMPILATGTSRRVREGFTFVELLVVIAVIGVAATAVVLSAPDPRPSVAVEAERFGARLSLARDEAVLTNTSVAVRLSSDGYGFEVFDGRVWQGLNGALGKQTWPEGVSAPHEGRVVFDASGLAEPVAWPLERDGVSVVVAVDGSGEVSLVR